MRLQLGDSASRSLQMTAEMIETFAQLSGDTNPIHLDEAYAATTPFGKRVAHGILSASVISATLANQLPGQGTIYLGQSLRFKKPVYVGDTLTATVTVTAYREEKKIAILDTRITNQEGMLVIEGEATVLVP
jgi:3-hydroxybutyryl-CoA dehydratase